VSPKVQQQQKSCVDLTANLDNATVSKKKAIRKRKFSQEELLIESIRETEPANERWLLARRRVEAISSDDKKKAENISARRDFKVIMKYHSLKGCYNTLTFPDMDHVPAIFRRRKLLQSDQATNATQSENKFNSACIITGKQARYRDPLTGQSYYDLNAFRELRRRHHAGLPLDSPLIESQSLAVDSTLAKSPQSSVHTRSDSSSLHSIKEQIHDNNDRDDDQFCEHPESSDHSSVTSSHHYHELCELNPTSHFPTDTRPFFSSTGNDDIGDSNDIDIDTLFPTNEQPHQSSVSNGYNNNCTSQSFPFNISNADNNNIDNHDNHHSEDNHVHDELITSIVTPPQQINHDFVQHNLNDTSNR